MRRTKHTADPGIDARTGSEAKRQTDPWAGPDYDPERELLALSEQTARMLSVAQVLVASNRHLDCEGLQRHVGLLCAKALDLPPGHTGFAKLELKRLAAQLDQLHAAIRERAE
jgi:hypothetical protein